MKIFILMLLLVVLLSSCMTIKDERGNILYYGWSGTVTVPVGSVAIVE